MIYKRDDSPYWWAAWYVKAAADGRLIKRAKSTKIEWAIIDKKTGKRLESKEAKEKARKFEEDISKAFTELAEKKKLEKFISETAEIMTAKAIPASGMALSLVWDKYSEDSTQAKRAKRTQASKRQAWMRFEKWIEDNHPELETINDISREIAKEYLDSLKKKSSSTFNNNKNSLSSIWHVLSVMAGLKENLWRLFAGAENDSIRYRNFSLEEVKGILAVSNDFWRIAVAVAFYTGLRFKDIVFLRKSQIHGDYIVLTPQKTRRTHKSVHIYIHPDLKKILDHQISIAVDDYLFPEAVQKYETKKFQREFGNILALKDEKKDKKPIIDDERGIVGFHSLRHTIVTIAEEMGVERKVIQGVVGHGSPVMTGHYSHDIKSIKQIEKLPSLLVEGKGKLI